MGTDSRLGSRFLLDGHFLHRVSFQMYPFPCRPITDSLVSCNQYLLPISFRSTSDSHSRFLPHSPLQPHDHHNLLLSQIPDLSLLLVHPRDLRRRSNRHGGTNVRQTRNEERVPSFRHDSSFRWNDSFTEYGTGRENGEYESWESTFVGSTEG